MCIHIITPLLQIQIKHAQTRNIAFPHSVRSPTIRRIISTLYGKQNACNTQRKDFKEEC